MKKIIGLMFLSILLVGCSATETVEKEFEFIELSDENKNSISLDKKVYDAIYVSDEDRAYYRQKISAYDYNRWKLKKGDKVKFLYRKSDDTFFNLDEEEEDIYELTQYVEKKTK